MLALVENVPETYGNLRTILELLELEKIKHVDASDFKLINTVLGISVS
jgi:hypothetical protein